MSLITELRRRNVFRVAALYVVSGWLLLQMADVLFGLLDVPGWGLRLVLGILILGFPVALVLSWIYELTPEGVKLEKDVDRSQSITPETGRKLSLVTLAVLVVAVLALVFDYLTGRQSPELPVAEDDAPLLAVPDAAKSRPAEAASEGAGSTAAQPQEAPDRRSVAVLPFASRSTRQEDVFFTDGMHDDLLTQLAKISALKVISRTSVMEYRDTEKKIPEIAHELGVATILEGGVQRAGNRVRINVQLIDAETDEHLWAESYDRELTAENIFDIQSEMARNITAALQATLSPEEEQRLDRPLTRDLPALEAYRRAIWLREGLTANELDRAEQELRFALERDPSFAAAEAMLAEVHLSRYWFRNPDPVQRDRAWAAIQRGRAIDPTLAALDVAEGYYHYWGFLDYDAALKVLDRAARAAPNDSRVIQLRAWVNRRAGNYEEAIADLKHALELDPRNELSFSGLGETLATLKRFDEGLPLLEQALQLNPDAVYNRATLAISVANIGELERARELLENQTAFDQFVPWYRWWLAVAVGDYDYALSVSDFGAHVSSKNALYMPEMIRGLTLFYRGEDEAARGELEMARASLERGLAEHPDDFRYMKALCITDGALGLREGSRARCAAALENLPFDKWQEGPWISELAMGPALAGDSEAALAAVEAALTHPTGPNAALLRRDPAFRSLEGNPRYEALLEQYNVSYP